MGLGDTRGWQWYLRRRTTIAFLILALGMGLALWREDSNRRGDIEDVKRADVQLCVAFDVLKANNMASLLTLERDFAPPGREQEFSDAIRKLVEQYQIVDCSRLVQGFEELQIVVTIPPPPTTVP